MKILVGVLIVWLLFPIGSFSQDAEKTLMSISTPEELTRWFSKDFSYHWKFPDAPQTPQETISTKEGDCEDFALLASTVLTRLGIPNEIIVIKFRDLKMAHAICVWQGKNGFYNFISSKELCRTKKRTLEEAVKKFYPDYEKISRKRYARTYLSF